MSGSRDSPYPRNGHPAPSWPPESGEHARALEYERWLQEQRQIAEQQQAQQPPFTYASQDPPGYQPVTNYPGQPASGQAGYPAQYERFDPQSQPQQQHRGGYPQHPEPPAPIYPGHHANEAPHPHTDHSFGGQRLDYSQPPQAARSHPVDPQSWDLSHYQPSRIPAGYHDSFGGQQGEPPAPQGWPPPPQDQLQRHTQPAGWQQPAPHADPYGRQTGYHDQHAQAGYPPQPAHYDQGGHHPGAEHEYEGDGEAVEEPRRGPSTLMIVGALVGAIAIGGGLAFAYKQFTSGKGGTKVAQVSRPSDPAKVRPQNPGGKSFDHTDKASQNGLTSASLTEPSRMSDVDGGAKKVATIPITVNRDGTLTPQPTAVTPLPPSSGVPGLVLDGPPPLRGAQATAPLPPPPVARQAPPAPPRVADLPLPKVIARAPAPSIEDASASEPEPQRAPVPKKKAGGSRDDFVSQQAGVASTTSAAVGAPSGLGSAVKTAAPKAASSGAGFVAVLASKKTRQEALNSFADMHSQYPELLGGMTPDVREANLADKGVWYRLIVGPPGSREAAKTLCAKLKERGMKDCWPVSY